MLQADAAAYIRRWPLAGATDALRRLAVAGLCGLVACADMSSEVQSALPVPLEERSPPEIDELDPVEDTGPWSLPEFSERGPSLLLNEVVSDNASTWDDGSGSFPDWIEIYNPTTEPVELGRVALSDKSGRVWYGQSGEIAPGAFTLLVANGQEGEYAAPFALDAEDEQLVLRVDGVGVDRLDLGVLDTDVAWVRVPDGGEWLPSIRTTPGAANVDPGETLDPSDLVFQTDSLWQIDIQLDAADLDALRADRLTYVEAGVIMPEGHYDRVGVRLKAYVGSSRTIDQKCGFKIDFNRYESNTWHGIETLTLNNLVQDNSYIHEMTTYRLVMEMGIPAPRIGYAWVRVNGADYGLYLIVESIDDRFLKRWFRDPTANLYEGAYGVDLYDNEIDSFELDEGVENGRPELYAVEAVMDGPATDAAIADLESLVDLDAFIDMMAVEAVSLHWDGYTTANNYRLYDDPDRGFVMIPWGADQTWASYSYAPYSGGGRLHTFCLANSGCRNRFADAMIRAADVTDSLPLRAEA